MVFSLKVKFIIYKFPWSLLISDCIQEEGILMKAWISPAQHGFHLLYNQCLSFYLECYVLSNVIFLIYLYEHLSKLKGKKCQYFIHVYTINNNYFISLYCCSKRITSQSKNKSNSKIMTWFLLQMRFMHGRVQVAREGYNLVNSVWIATQFLLMNCRKSG